MNERNCLCIIVRHSAPLNRKRVGSAGAAAEAQAVRLQAYQQKVAGKKGPDAAAALDGGITEKEALRQGAQQRSIPRPLLESLPEQLHIAHTTMHYCYTASSH